MLGQRRSAHQPALSAAVVYYGEAPGSATNAATEDSVAAQLANVKAPVLGLYGGQDQGIPASHVREAESKARVAGKTVEFIIYPDAPHGFHADYRPSYRQADAEDGWKRLLAWFERYGVTANA